MGLFRHQDFQAGDLVQDKHTGEKGIVHKIIKAGTIGVSTYIAVWMIKRKYIRNFTPDVLNIVEKGSKDVIRYVNSQVNQWAENRSHKLPKPSSTPSPSSVESVKTEATKEANAGRSAASRIANSEAKSRGVVHSTKRVTNTLSVDFAGNNMGAPAGHLHGWWEVKPAAKSGIYDGWTIQTIHGKVTPRYKSVSEIQRTPIYREVVTPQLRTNSELIQGLLSGGYTFDVLPDGIPGNFLSPHVVPGSRSHSTYGDLFHIYGEAYSRASNVEKLKLNFSNLTKSQREQYKALLRRIKNPEFGFTFNDGGRRLIDSPIFRSKVITGGALAGGMRPMAIFPINWSVGDRDPFMHEMGHLGQNSLWSEQDAITQLRSQFPGIAISSLDKSYKPDLYEEHADTFRRLFFGGNEQNVPRITSSDAVFNRQTPKTKRALRFLEKQGVFDVHQNLLKDLYASIGIDISDVAGKKSFEFVGYQEHTITSRVLDGLESTAVNLTAEFEDYEKKWMSRGYSPTEARILASKSLSKKYKNLVDYVGPKLKFGKKRKGHKLFFDEVSTGSTLRSDRPITGDFRAFGVGEETEETFLTQFRKEFQAEIFRLGITETDYLHDTVLTEMYAQAHNFDGARGLTTWMSRSSLYHSMNKVAEMELQDSYIFGPDRGLNLMSWVRSSEARGREQIRQLKGAQKSFRKYYYGKQVPMKEHWDDIIGMMTALPEAEIGGGNTFSGQSFASAWYRLQNFHGGYEVEERKAAALNILTQAFGPAEARRFEERIEGSENVGLTLSRLFGEQTAGVLNTYIAGAEEDVRRKQGLLKDLLQYTETGRSLNFLQYSKELPMRNQWDTNLDDEVLGGLDDLSGFIPNEMSPHSLWGLSDEKPDYELVIDPISGGNKRVYTKVAGRYSLSPKEEREIITDSTGFLGSTRKLGDAGGLVVNITGHDVSRFSAFLDVESAPLNSPYVVVGREPGAGVGQLYVDAIKRLYGGSEDAIRDALLQSNEELAAETTERVIEQRAARTRSLLNRTIHLAGTDKLPSNLTSRTVTAAQLSQAVIGDISFIRELTRGVKNASKSGNESDIADMVQEASLVANKLIQEGLDTFDEKSLTDIRKAVIHRALSSRDWKLKKPRINVDSLENPISEDGTLSLKDALRDPSLSIEDLVIARDVFDAVETPGRTGNVMHDALAPINRQMVLERIPSIRKVDGEIRYYLGRKGGELTQEVTDLLVNFSGVAETQNGNLVIRDEMGAQYLVNPENRVGDHLGTYANAGKGFDASGSPYIATEVVGGKKGHSYSLGRDLGTHEAPLGMIYHSPLLGETATAFDDLMIDPQDEIGFLKFVGKDSGGRTSIFTGSPIGVYEELKHLGNDKFVFLDIETYKDAAGEYTNIGEIGVAEFTKGKNPEAGFKYRGGRNIAVPEYFKELEEMAPKGSIMMPENMNMGSRNLTPVRKIADYLEEKVAKGYSIGVFNRGADLEKMAAAASTAGDEVLAARLMNLASNNSFDVMLLATLKTPGSLPSLEELALKSGVLGVTTNREHRAQGDARLLGKVFFHELPDYTQVSGLQDWKQATLSDFANVGDIIELPRMRGDKWPVGVVSNIGSKDLSNRQFVFKGIQFTPEGNIEFGLQEYGSDRLIRITQAEATHYFGGGFLSSVTKVDPSKVDIRRQVISEDLANRRLHRLLNGEVMSGGFEHQLFDLKYQAMTAADPEAWLQNALTSDGRYREEDIQKVVTWYSQFGWDDRMRDQFRQLQGWYDSDWQNIHKKFFADLDQLAINPDIKAEIIKERFQKFKNVFQLGVTEIDAVERSVGVTPRMAGVPNPTTVYAENQAMAERLLADHVLQATRTTRSTSEFHTLASEYLGLKGNLGANFEFSQESGRYTAEFKQGRKFLGRELAESLLQADFNIGGESILDAVGASIGLSSEQIRQVAGSNPISNISSQIVEHLKGLNPQQRSALAMDTSSGLFLLHTVFDPKRGNFSEQQRSDMIAQMLQSDQELLGPGLSRTIDDASVRLHQRIRQGIDAGNKEISSKYLAFNSVSDNYLKWGQTHDPAFSMEGLTPAQVRRKYKALGERALSRLYLHGMEDQDVGLNWYQSQEIKRIMGWGSVQQDLQTVDTGVAGNAARWRVAHQVEKDGEKIWQTSTIQDLVNTHKNAKSFKNAISMGDKQTWAPSFMDEFVERYYMNREASPIQRGMQAMNSVNENLSPNAPSPGRSALLAANAHASLGVGKAGMILDDIIPKSYDDLAKSLKNVINGPNLAFLGITVAGIGLLGSGMGLQGKRERLEEGDEVDLTPPHPGRRRVKETIEQPKHMSIIAKVRAKGSASSSPEDLINTVHSAMETHMGGKIEKSHSVVDNSQQQNDDDKSVIRRFISRL